MAFSCGFGAVTLLSTACQMDMGSEGASAQDDGLEFECDFNNLRSSEARWQLQAVPSPRICEVR